MGLADEAARVAAQFEYSAHDVNRGVVEFLAEMGTLFPFGVHLMC